MNLHLTTAEWERIAAAGSGVLFRAGEYDARYRAMGVRTPSNMRHPPAEFVEAAAPCETCGGRGLYEHPTVRLVHDVTCPDCLDGKRRVAVVVPCGYCSLVCERLHSNYEQAASEVGWDTQEASRKPWSEVPESNRRTMMLAVSRTLHDCNEGFVTIGHVVVTFGPLVVFRGPFSTHWPATDLVSIDTLTAHLRRHAPKTDPAVRRWEMVGPIPLPPDVDPQTLVGKYAIGVEVVS